MKYISVNMDDQEIRMNNETVGINDQDVVLS